jgi:hypothetical protein
MFPEPFSNWPALHMFFARSLRALKSRKSIGINPILLVPFVSASVRLDYNER